MLRILKIQRLNKNKKEEKEEEKKKKKKNKDEEEEQDEKAEDEEDTEEKKKEEKKKKKKRRKRRRRKHTHARAQRDTHRPLFILLQSLNYVPNKPYNSTHCLQSRWQCSTIYPVTGNMATA